MLNSIFFELISSVLLRLLHLVYLCSLVGTLLCIRRKSTLEYQLDPKIERTFRRLRRENQGFVELGRMAAIAGGNEDRDELEENLYKNF